MTAIRWSVFTFFVPLAIWAQAERPQFEVATVKPAPPIVAGPEVNIGIRIDGAQFTCTSYSLRDYVRFAYDVKPFQVQGPDWLTQDRFAITARIPDGDRAHIREMLQSLLEERFKLKLHHEKKEFPVYALLVGKNGIRMTEVPPDPADNAAANVDVKAQGGRAGVNVDLGHGSYFSFANSKLEGRKLSMPSFADMLGMFADRPVVDATELKGRYDFTAQLSQEDYNAMLIRSAIRNGVSLPPQVLKAMEGASGDTLFNAVQLLGLKLEPRKAPLEVIVVDSAEKTPIEN